LTVTMDAQRDPTSKLDAGTLFRSHAGFVANFLARLGVAFQDVPDLVQEVFLVVHRKGGYVPGPARPTSWLAEIALRVASGARRTRRRRPEDPASDELEAAVAPVANPLAAAEIAQSLRRLQGAIERLDRPHRAVFILFELEEESCASIAAGLGIPVGTVYSRLHTARRQIIESYEALASARSRHGEAPVTPAAPLRLRDDEDAPALVRSDRRIACAVPILDYDVAQGLSRFEIACGGGCVDPPAQAGLAEAEVTASSAGLASVLKVAGLGFVVAAGIGSYLVMAPERAPEALEAVEIDRLGTTATEQVTEPRSPEEEVVSSPAAVVGPVARDDAEVAPDDSLAQEPRPEPREPRARGDAVRGSPRGSASDQDARARQGARADHGASPDRDQDDAVRREMRQLVETRRALERDPARALALAIRAQESFPQGFYQQEWQALHILALTRLRHFEEAIERAEAFAARHPRSPFKDRIERALQPEP
jgi:RNA polymerase sigma-70 factor, ECF subfamily